ncbi:serine/threonine-protein kinase [Zafaria sp. Z1313]|uniref:serine/threonine-protein kinase n=1 Tax=unclassified Zafaria TaxID=2828765 RepID=UPI002E7960A0|nr:serine/threonine-protein kinase [Zafaria sp. J156]MEE1620005.1 serine/threonine-protein kinase [Zafaria sp. J156]
MSGKRPPAPPPVIGGYEYLDLLGSGGFSDVYLYQQDRPRRKVAVKVLLSDLKTESARRRFESEANLMAQLSSHPYIVTIFEADITDEGHSYLAMEYCSRPSLDVRYRRARLGVDEVLTVGIQVASAVETAHRAGIVHRDIKPANILVTDYNRPALTDFGISGTTDALDDEAGLSIPWSPPEAFAGGSPDGVRMDVWSLGATLYTLLAGRSPFVRSGADNSQRELIGRITSAPLPPLHRADVPQALEQALATAMAKNPAARYGSAQELALALQRVQSELGLSVTPFEVLEEAPAAEDGEPADDGGEATRVRQVVSIDPDAATGTSTGRPGPGGWPTTPAGPTAPTAPAADPADGWDATVLRPAPAAEPDDGATIMRPRLPDGGTRGSRTTPAAGGPAAGGAAGGQAASPASDAERPGWVPSVPPGAPAPDNAKQRFPTGLVAGLGAAAAVVLAGVFVANAVLGGTDRDDGDADGGGPVQDGPADALAGRGGIVPPVEGFSAEDSGADVVFSWTNPDPQDGDAYYWAPVTATEQGANTLAQEPTATTPAAEGQPTCIQVVLVRESGRASDPARYCAPD